MLVTAGSLLKVASTHVIVQLLTGTLKIFVTTVARGKMDNAIKRKEEVTP